MKRITGLRQKPNKRLVRPEQHERRLAILVHISLGIGRRASGNPIFARSFLGIVQLTD